LSSSGTTAYDGPAVQISDVSVEETGDLLHGNLERPVDGELVGGFCVPLLGWALAPSGEQVGIQVSHRRHVLRRVARRIGRPDIALAYPDLPGSDRSGFSLALEVLRLPSEFDLRLSGTLGEEAMPLARISGVRRTLEPAHDLALAPLALTTLGRTGSTLLLTLLSLHPSIAAFRPVAYDSRPFAYWLDAAIAMAAPGSRLRLLDSAAEANGWWLGQAPVAVEALARLDEKTSELLLGGAVEEMLQSAVTCAAQFAQSLAQGETHEQVSYSAEKCWPGHVPRLLSELCANGKEIFLVRDFRDVLTSILAFNAKRGYAAFGREHVDSDEQFIERLSVDAEALASSWSERRERSLLVRYEDLVSDLEATLARVFEYLSLESSPASTRSIVDHAQVLLETTRLQHRTTDRVSASSGRWRTDLSPAMQEACTEAFEGPLRQFGYA
jgi:hypothetical protein